MVPDRSILDSKEKQVKKLAEKVSTLPRQRRHYFTTKFHCQWIKCQHDVENVTSNSFELVIISIHNVSKKQ
jgi:hypothetical protein